MISAHIKSRLESLVRDVIRSGEIVSVIVSEDDGTDGGNWLNVTVVYDSKSKKLDPKEIAGITTKARRILIENEEEYFPVFYFILKSEASGLIAAE